MDSFYEVASIALELTETMREGLLFAAAKAEVEDMFWAVNTICDVGEALYAIERALEAVGIDLAPTLWQEWSDWLWEVLDRAARACVEQNWEEARSLLEGQLLPCFEGWKEETTKILRPRVLC